MSKKIKIYTLIISLIVGLVAILWATKTNFAEAEPMMAIIGVIASILANVLHDQIAVFKNKLLGSKEKTEESNYSRRINELLQTLKASSNEIDNVFLEISTLSKDKEGSIQELEKTVQTLSQRENELKTKIETMEKVPIEAIRHFEEVLNKGDKRSAYRDYLLFFLGIVFSIIISIILKSLGYA